MVERPTPELASAQAAQAQLDYDRYEAARDRLASMHNPVARQLYRGVVAYHRFVATGSEATAEISGEHVNMVGQLEAYTAEQQNQAD